MHRMLAPFLFALLGLSISCTAGGDLDDDDSATADDDDAVGDDDDSTPPPDTVTITTADGLNLNGIWRTPGGDTDQPAVLLLHQYARNNNDFNLVLDGFAEAGIATLALDLRSHGGSDAATVPFGELLTDPTQLPLDVQAALAWMHARPEVDTARVGVMGLSVGANLAVVANHNRVAWGVKTTVVVSANMERAQDLADVVDLDLESSIYIAADLEDPQGDHADALGAITADPVQVQRVLGTSAHGVDLLTASANVREGVVAWFVDNL
jgi:dienelactone hydrolase